MGRDDVAPFARVHRRRLPFDVQINALNFRRNGDRFLLARSPHHYSQCQQTNLCKCGHEQPPKSNQVVNIGNAHNICKDPIQIQKNC